MKTDKQLADTMRVSLDRKALQKQYTFGLYSVECEGVNKEKWYAPPFVARDDESALMALIEVSKSHPEIQRKMVYCLGSYCAVNGKIVANKPRVVVMSEKEIKDEKEVPHAV